MAAWSDTTKHLPSSINSGNQYTVDDDVSLQELNNTVENAFYAARVAENAQAATNNGVSYDAQTPTSTEQSQARTNLGLGTVLTDLSNKADKDASNLSSANIASFNAALGSELTSNKMTSIDDFNSATSSTTKYISNKVADGLFRGYGVYHDNYFDNENVFLDWVKNTAPTGAYPIYTNINGGINGMLIMKASSSYGAILRYGYNGMSLNRLVAGSWLGWGN